MFSYRNSTRIALIACMSTWLASCGVMGGGELATFDLSAPHSFPNLTSSSKAQILVQVPTALKSLDSEMIVIRPTGAEIAYYGDAQWSDRLPNVVQDKLIQALENSGKVRSVAKPGDGVVADYKIATAIRSFELVDSASPTANVEFSVKIINDRTGRIRASKQFQASTFATVKNPVTGVKALDKSFNIVLSEMVEWILKTI